VKLILRVLAALKEGADTSGEISEMIGHPVANISATLNEMEKSGLARKTGRQRRSGLRSPPSHCWEPTDWEVKT
jgi:DNA-binding IclR family transcriptional regulator